MRRRAFMETATTGVAMSPLSPFETAPDPDADELYRTRVYLDSNDTPAVVVYAQAESAFAAAKEAANYVKEAEEAPISSFTVGMHPVSRPTFRQLRADGHLYMPRSGIYRRVRDD